MLRLVDVLVPSQVQVLPQLLIFVRLTGQWFFVMIILATACSQARPVAPSPDQVRASAGFPPPLDSPFAGNSSLKGGCLLGRRGFLSDRS